MKIVRNCIIAIEAKVTGCVEYPLFHANSKGDLACAIHRNANGEITSSRGTGSPAVMFGGYQHNHWEDNINRRGFIVDSHCVNPHALNSGDLRRLARKAAKMAKVKK